MSNNKAVVTGATVSYMYEDGNTTLYHVRIDARERRVEIHSENDTLWLDLETWEALKVETDRLIKEVIRNED